MNKPFFGDNLDILREHVKDETVDLVYLDPPFNSKRDYSVLFKTPKGHESDAQITPMKEEAIKEGYYDADRFGPDYPKLQILTIEALMSGTERPRYPDLSLGRSTFKRAGVEDMGGEQGRLL